MGHTIDEYGLRHFTIVNGDGVGLDGDIAEGLKRAAQ